MKICILLYSLLCLLFVSHAVVYDQEIDSGSIAINEAISDSRNVEVTNPDQEIDSGCVAINEAISDRRNVEETNPDGEVGSTAIKLTKNETPLSRLTSVYSLISKGNELKKQYSFMIPKLASVILRGGPSMNPFKLISFLPYIILALQKANETPPIEQNNSNQLLELNNLNLASTLENPENFKKLFSSEARGELAIDSMKLLAGPKASAMIDKLINEVKEKAMDNKDGVTGIKGENLMITLKNSDTLKQLFQSDELANDGLNFMNAYMDSYLSQDIKNAKQEFITEMRATRSFQKNDQGADSSIKGVVQGTLSDSVSAFFKVGQKKINEKLQSINSDADKNVADWKQMFSSGNDGYPPPSGFKNMVLNNTPNPVLKILATGNVLKNQFGHLIPQLAAYFLPVGVAMDALKFVCLVTYVMLIARRENMIQGIDRDQVKIPGLNTEKIIDTLNNKKIMEQIFPLNDHSSVGIEMLKFLSGPEAIVVDKLVNELKKINIEKGGDQPLNKLSLFDLLINTEFFKKLYTIKEYADNKMKNYLGVDIGQIKKEIVNEMEKNNVEKSPENSSYFNYGAIKPVTDTLSAAYKVGLKKAYETKDMIYADIQKEADKMTQTPTSPENESTSARLFRKAASLAPISLLYGVAGGVVAANRFGSFFQKAENSAVAEPSKNNDATVKPKN